MSGSSGGSYGNDAATEAGSYWDSGYVDPGAYSGSEPAGTSGYGPQSPWGDSAVNIGIPGRGFENPNEINPSWGGAIGSFALGPIGGLIGNIGVRAYNAITDYNNLSEARTQGFNQGFGVNPTGYVGNSLADNNQDRAGGYSDFPQYGESGNVIKNALMQLYQNPGGLNKLMMGGTL